MNTQPASKDDPAISPLARRAAAVCDWFANIPSWGWLAVAILAIVAASGTSSAPNVAPKPAPVAAHERQSPGYREPGGARERLHAHVEAVVCVIKLIANSRGAKTSQLHDPETKFFFNESGVLVCGWVESLNRSGKMVREQWAVSLNYPADEWKIESVKLGERYYGQRNGRLVLF
jgi:hypothetical protein